MIVKYFLNGDVAEGDALADRIAGSWIGAPECIPGAIADGVETLSWRTVLANDTSLFVSSQHPACAQVGECELDRVQMPDNARRLGFGLTVRSP